METACIAVGSTRRPKLEAVREAVRAFGPLLGEETLPTVLGFEVNSGVNHTPQSRGELMQGARQRAESLAELLRPGGPHAAYFVGLEGGLDVTLENGRKHVFLESWAYVSDGRCGYFGCSGGIEIPASLAAEVLSSGTELAAAIDALAGTAGIRDAEGAWGVLSANLISRQESFRIAVIAAFAPFYNAKWYRGAAEAGR